MGNAVRSSANTSWRECVGLFSDRWRVLRGALVGGVLTLLTTFVGLFSYFEKSGPLAVLVSATLTGIWCLITIPIAAYYSWRDERIARIASDEARLKAERDLIAAKVESAPRLSIKSVRFAEFNYADMTATAFQQLSLEEIVRTHATLYTAVIEIENFGKPSRASGWAFEATVEGKATHLTPMREDWPPPTWLNGNGPIVLLRDLDRTYFVRDCLYTIMLYLGSKPKLGDGDLATFRFTFTDNDGAASSWP